MKKSFNVFGVNVKVKYFDEHDDEHKLLMGYCQKSPIEIYINKKLTNDEKSSTLNHELIHAIMFRIGLDQIISPETQELLCESIGNFIHENYSFKRKR